MNALNNGLKFLLEKYEVNKDVEIINEAQVKINGVNMPLLPWRWERRLIELKNLAQGTAASGALENISVLRVAHITKKNSDLEKILKREIDICEFIIGSKAAEIFAIGDLERTINVIMKLENGVVCTVEVSATLACDAKDIDKHEIIAEKGVACDRVVDTQVPQSSIYLFTDNKLPQEYVDVDAELYGLNVDEAAIVRQSFDLAANDYTLDTDAKHLDKLMETVKGSLQNVENIIL